MSSTGFSTQSRPAQRSGRQPRKPAAASLAKINLAALDALPAHAAILNDKGKILVVNRHWREFARQNGGTQRKCGVGANYLNVCRRGAQAASPAKMDFVQALEHILSGRHEEFEFHYPCHSPTQPRWFLAKFMRFRVGRHPFILVTHEIANTGSWSRETFEKLSLIARKSSNSIVLTDKAGMVEWVNGAFETMTGRACAEVTGMHVVELLKGTAPDGPVFKAIELSIGRGESLATTLLSHRPNGMPLWTDLRMDPVRNAEGDAHHFVLMQSDITAKRLLEKEVVNATLRERERLARDLHDSLGQELTGARLLVSTAISKLRFEREPVGMLLDAADSLQRVLNEIRVLAQAMAPVQLARGLGPALAGLASHMSAAGVNVKFGGDMNIQAPPEMAEQLFRIAQEAVSNSLRHSEGDKVVITLKRTTIGLELRITDNGQGFTQFANTSGTGMRIMNYRAGAILATLHIETRQSGGTRVICTAPYPA